MARSPYADNIKFFLILLVVLGHLIAPLREKELILRSIYLFIYSFHMPMFVLLSGYFSSDRFTKEDLIKNIISLIMPYVIFQNIFMFMEATFANNTFSLLRPFNAMWYLSSLFAWRIMLPFFSKIPKAVLWSIVLALAAGCSEYFGQTLSASRTFAFFPFFFAGYKLKSNPKYIDVIKLIPKSLSYGVLMLAVLLAFSFPTIDVRWFRGADAYSHIVDSWSIGAFKRLTALLASGFIGCAFLSVIPRKKTFFTYAGERTLYVYLFHFLLLRLSVHAGIYGKLIVINPLLLNFLFILFAIFATFVLSCDAFVRLNRPIVEPYKFLNNYYTYKIKKTVLYK